MTDTSSTPTPNLEQFANPSADSTPETAVDSRAPLKQNEHSGGQPAPLHKIDLDQKGSKMTKVWSKNIVIAISLAAVVMGSVTGYGVWKLQNRPGGGLGGGFGGGNEPLQQVADENVKAGDVFGSTSDDFKDYTEGYLEVGGVDGEGSHHLVRLGGESQTVYLTSSVTDLSKFEGMEVKVWGETNKGQKAGWLMDVGRVEVVKIEGQLPATE